MKYDKRVEETAKALYDHWLQVEHPALRFSWEDATEQLRGVFRVNAQVVIDLVEKHDKELYFAYMDME